MTSPSTAEYDCPRCGQVVTQRFYGPCEACRAALQNLTPPAPDPHFQPTKRMNGLDAIDWVANP